MKCSGFREQMNVLSPIYRLLGEGFNDGDIAVKMDLTEVKVEGCIAWIVYFLGLKSWCNTLQWWRDLSIAGKAART